jgi:protocatechuate 3,4-dioxygenase beta subunit
MRKRSKKTMVIVVAILVLMVAAIAYMIKSKDSNNSTNCALVITKIQNKATNEVKDNPTTCIPDGWEKYTGTTSSNTQSEEDESYESDYTKVVIDPVSNIAANQQAQTVKSADQLVSCGYTRQTTQGPYYISGTKKITNGNLNYDNLASTPLKIAGYVYGSEDNSKPIASAKIEIWQTDNSGNYHPEANGDISKYSDDQISLRGYTTTDSSGYYTFTSIYPGEYTGRARHIHVRATANGFTTIVSQIIMSLPGDNLSAANDNIARALDSKCSAPSITKLNGVDTGFYSFWLRSN